MTIIRRCSVLAIACAVAVVVAAVRAAPQDQPPASQAAVEKAKAFVTMLANGEFEKAEASFDATMKTALPVEKLQQAWAAVVQQAGPFSRQVSARAEERGPYHVGIVTCEFGATKVDVAVVYDAAGLVAGLNMRPAAAAAPPYSPPPYASPASYTERDVTVGSDPWTLPGTLTVPVGDGPFPAVVLVHGSGPNDRNETIAANRPFEDLALGLASRGVAVLRYDKRTKVYPSKLGGAGFTVADETVDDAHAAVQLLTHEDRIDPRRVFVLGHSLGGMLVPRIAAAAPEAAGFIVMAGAARSLEQAVLEQMQYLANADGTVSPAEQMQIDEAQKLVDAVRGLTPADAGKPGLVFGAPASYWLDLRGYDPPQAARAMTRPLLVLQGERDYQVTMAEFARWKAALDGRPNATFHSYPALNHLFIAGSGPSVPSEYLTPGHVAEAVVEDIAGWMAGVSR